MERMGVKLRRVQQGLTLQPGPQSRTGGPLVVDSFSNPPKDWRNDNAPSEKKRDQPYDSEDNNSNQSWTACKSTETAQ